MSQDELISRLSQLTEGVSVSMGPQYVTCQVAPTQLHQFCKRLKEEKDLAFDYLISLTGVDMPEYMTTVYHLESTTHRHMIVVRANTANRTEPILPSVCDIWISALWHEREAHDLLGLKYENNPDQRRLFLEDGWGFPLRKDYSDPTRIVER